MNIIPISRAATACDEPSGEVVKVNVPLTRRGFLKGSAVLMGSIASSSVLFTLAPSPAWALPLKRFTKDEGAVLMQMGRVLYPHDKLPDAVYALLAKDLDAGAARDAAIAAQLRSGIRELDRLAGGSFLQADGGRKLKAVTDMEGTPFFHTVRAQGVTSIYDNDMAYAVFGYPGASWDKGGYITRGFQDLNWLPAPPEEVSPPPYMG
ncbi:twin-arginine translocation signal domain-containing protein [Telluria sp. B2]